MSLTRWKPYWVTLWLAPSQTVTTWFSDVTETGRSQPSSRGVPSCRAPVENHSRGGAVGAVKGSSVWTLWPGATPQQRGHVQHHCGGCWGTKSVFTWLGSPSFSQLSLQVPLGPNQSRLVQRRNTWIQTFVFMIVVGRATCMHWESREFLKKDDAISCILVPFLKKTMCSDWKLSPAFFPPFFSLSESALIQFTFGRLDKNSAQSDFTFIIYIVLV